MPVSASDILERLRVIEDAERGRLQWRRAWTKADGGLSIEYADVNGGRVHASLEAGVSPDGLRLEREVRDSKLPGLALLLERPGAELVTHRPGRRAVVRFDGETGTVYGRALRPKRIKPIADALTWIGREGQSLFGDTTPVERDDTLGIVVCRELPGQAMEDLAGRCPVRYIDAAARLGEALTSTRITPPDWLPTHSSADEVALLSAKARELHAYLPLLASRAETVLKQLGPRLLAHPTDLGLIHRDLYDRQVLVDEDGSVRVIDLDTLARGEPALDVGNMVAHFELRGLLEPHLHRVMARAAAAFTAAAGPGLQSPERVEDYASAARLRLAMLFALRPDHAEVAAVLLERVEQEAARDPGTETTRIHSDRALRGRGHSRRKISAPHFVVIGCPRSGTTLLERMLDAHGQIAMAHETHWIARYGRRRYGLGPKRSVTPALLDVLYGDKRFVRVAPGRRAIEGWLDQGPLSYEELVDRVFTRFGDAMGAPVVGDKSTGGYIHDLGRLHSVCPQAKIIHLVRDGRDVCLSMLDWPKAERAAGRFPMWRDDPVATTAAWWRWQVLGAREAGAGLGSQVYREIRYEHLIADPETACRHICEFLGLPFEPAMTTFASGRTSRSSGRSANRAWLPPTPGVRDWRRDMPRRDSEIFEAIAGDALEVLGYERRHPAPSDEARRRAAEMLRRWEAQSGETASNRLSREESHSNGNARSVGEEP